MRKLADVLLEFHQELTAYKAGLNGEEFQAARDRLYERTEQEISLIYADFIQEKRKDNLPKEDV